MALSFLFGKNSNDSDEYKRFKKAMERNPSDQGLKGQFIKFCLLNRFTQAESVENHIPEALTLFESFARTETFDLQCYYLVGKYYQEDKNPRLAYKVYYESIKRFNDYVGKNPDHKSDNMEMAYSISLNLMTLQTNTSDPVLERCFKLIHKSYPLHVKRFELENEMGKPSPDQTRVKQLAEEVRRLKAEAEKEVPAAPKVKLEEAPAAKPAEKEDIFTKLFRVPSPDPAHLPMDIPRVRSTSEKDDKNDFLKLSPLSETPHSYMIFQNNNWEGPFTPVQLRSKGALDPEVWVCRVGSQLVTQAHEVSDLHSIIQQKV